MNAMLRLSAVAFVLLAVTPAVAQNDTQDLAAAVVREMAPAVDDPDATVLDLVDTALAHRRSPAACFLVEEALRQLGAVQQPAVVRDHLAAAVGNERMHGLLAVRLQELRCHLDRAADGAETRDPNFDLYPGSATELLIVGPFGDGGDHFVGVPFAPELAFPALGTELGIRDRKVKVRSVTRQPAYRRIGLADPANDLNGCYYGLQRVKVGDPTNAFLEVECDAEYEVFVDGTSMLKVRPWLEPGPARRYLALHLPAGPHEALVKACTANRHAAALRWVDAEGTTLTTVVQLPATAPPQPILDRATLENTPFVTALDVFARAAKAGDASATVRIAAVRCAQRYDADPLALAIAELLHNSPPVDPVEMLALAVVTTRLDLPDEIRAAEARALEEKALTTLPHGYHQGCIAEASLLEQQDRREDAMRLLAKQPTAGPTTWSYRTALADRLHFGAENTPLLREWAKACPHDPRPLTALARQASSSGDARGALALYIKAADLRPDQSGPRQQAFDIALDLGEFDQIPAWLDRLAPQTTNPAAQLPRWKLELRVAEAKGDAARVAQLLKDISGHPFADTRTLSRACERWLALGDQQQAIECLQRSLAIDPDQPNVRTWMAMLNGTPPEAGSAFAAFRRDGEAARKDFVATEREKTATSTVLIDQRIVEFHTDGSWLAEVHELRRINDLAGVEEFQSASAPASADEVLLLHSIAKDGQDYVPPKVQRNYSLQRLEPGAFVEWRYREHGNAPGPNALRSERFYFQSSDAPLLVSELIVILPQQGRGELRGHDLGKPTRTETLPDGRQVLVFTRSDAPRLAQERLSPGASAVMPYAEYGEDDVPFATQREVRMQILQRTLPTPAVQALAAQIFANAGDDRTKVVTAWSWCQKEIEDGEAGSANHTILRKKGNRFLAAMALLRAAGLDVVPTLSRGERSDLADDDDVPVFEGADSHVLPGALITTSRGEAIHLFIDTPRHWPLGAIPAGRSGSTTFVLRETGTEMLSLPASRDAAQAVAVRGKAVITEGKAQLTATIEVGDVQGYGLAERIRELKEDVRKLAARQIAQQLLTGWRVQDAQVVTDAPGEPFRLETKAQRSYVQQDGDRSLAPLPMPPAKLLARFGDRAERTLPARITADLNSEWDIELDPGADLALAEVPPQVFVEMDSLLYQLTVKRIGEHLRVHRSIRVRPTTLPKERFGDWLRALDAVDRADQSSLRFLTRPK